MIQNHELTSIPQPRPHPLFFSKRDIRPGPHHVPITDTINAHSKQARKLELLHACLQPATNIVLAPRPLSPSALLVG